MLKFKQFLILEQTAPGMEALQSDIDRLRQEVKDPNKTEAEKANILMDIDSKNKQLQSMKALSNSASQTTAPKDANIVAGPPSPGQTALTAPKTQKQSAFDALSSGKFDEMESVPQNITTPDDVTTSIGSSINTNQSLGKEQLGKFSKSFYRL